jgi:dTDP-L-rhamnose 4-epimerase
VALARKVLITGGAGFLGTHLARELLRRGCDLTLLDNLSPQIHGPNPALAPDLSGHVRLLQADVRDPAAWQQALPGQSCVVHLAAETGTGQSMYNVALYEQVNIGGTAVLYDLLTSPGAPTVERLVLASSRAIYGEGAYHCAAHGLVYPQPQPTAAKLAGQFDPVCPLCDGPCQPAATPESATLRPASFYGLTKQTQEQMTLMLGRALNLPTFALRFQNVYGPGQSLHNPYTGILAAFSTKARAAEPLEVFEDGAESRDFVYVADAVRATADCVTGDTTGQHAVNIGSGQRTALLSLANTIDAFYGGRSEVRISGRFRDGDIRHALADLALAQSLLGYQPHTLLADGLAAFLTWASQQPPAAASAHAQSLHELRQRGLLHG